MIYIVKHNEDIYVPLMKNYKYINVGKMYEDNGRDNINYLNPYINETTALYDLWKNHNDDIIGMIHYRRIFLDLSKDNVLSFNKAKEYLDMSSKDLICTYYHAFDNSTIYDYFKYTISIITPEALPIVEKYMNKLKSIDKNIIKYFKTKDRFIARNMFIARKEVIDRYCEWLFPFIIPLTEEFVKEDLENVGDQTRMIGHLVERLFSYWIEEVLGVNRAIGLPYITYSDD